MRIVEGRSGAVMIQRCKFSFDTGKQYTIPKELLAARWDGRGFYWFVNRGAGVNRLFDAIAASHHLTGIHLHLVKDRLVVTLTRREGFGAGEQTAHWEYSPIGATFALVAPSKGKIASEPGIDDVQRFLVSEFAQRARTPSGTQMSAPGPTTSDMASTYLGIVPKAPVTEERKEKEKEEKEEEGPRSMEAEATLAPAEAHKVLKKLTLPKLLLVSVDLTEGAFKKMSSHEKLKVLREISIDVTDHLTVAAKEANVTAAVTLSSLLRALKK